MAYLFGHAYGSHDVMLARVKPEYVLERRCYNYWDGRTYQADLARAQPVMKDVGHGAIYKSKLFHGASRSWVFVGCSNAGNNQVLLGVAPKLEGPFTIRPIMNAFPLQPMPAGSIHYCMYPHPWAYKEEDGELMITWSEGGPTGGVVAVKVQFARTMEVAEPRRIEAKEGDCCIIV